MWNHPVEPCERKRLLRLLIQDRNLIRAEVIIVDAPVYGGATRTLRLDRPLPIAQFRSGVVDSLIEAGHPPGRATSSFELKTQLVAEVDSSSIDTVSAKSPKSSTLSGPAEGIVSTEDRLHPTYNQSNRSERLRPARGRVLTTICEVAERFDVARSLSRSGGTKS